MCKPTFCHQLTPLLFGWDSKVKSFLIREYQSSFVLVLDEVISPHCATWQAEVNKVILVCCDIWKTFFVGFITCYETIWISVRNCIIHKFFDFSCSVGIGEFFDLCCFHFCVPFCCGNKTEIGGGLKMVDLFFAETDVSWHRFCRQTRISCLDFSKLLILVDSGNVR